MSAYIGKKAEVSMLQMMTCPSQSCIERLKADEIESVSMNDFVVNCYLEKFRRKMSIVIVFLYLRSNSGKICEILVNRQVN